MSEEAHLGMSDSKIWVSEHQRILDSRIQKVHQPVVWEKHSIILWGNILDIQVLFNLFLWYQLYHEINVSIPKYTKVIVSSPLGKVGERLSEITNNRIPQGTNITVETYIIYRCVQSNSIRKLTRKLLNSRVRKES